MLLLTATLSLAMFAVIMLALREVWQFRRKRDVYRLRRLTLRLATAGMLLFLLASILIGVRVFGLNEPDGVATLWIAFWGCIMLLTGGILCLVIADFQTIGDDALQNANQYWDDIAKTIAEHQQNLPKE
jgi:hypothetical protein